MSKNARATTGIIELGWSCTSGDRHLLIGIWNRHIKGIRKGIWYQKSPEVNSRFVSRISSSHADRFDYGIMLHAEIVANQMAKMAD
jgi:hypothetical protein